MSKAPFLMSFGLASLCLFPAMSVKAETEFTEKVPFMEQTLDRSTDFYGNGMKTLVDDVMKVTGSAETNKELLLKAANDAVADKMAKSKTGLWKTWKEMSKDGQVDQIQFWNTYRKLPEAILTPDRSPLWVEALPRILTPAEMVKWTTEETVRRARIEKAIQDYLTRGREEWKNKRLEVRKAEIDELISQWNLPETTATNLRNGLAASVTKSLGSWGQALEKQIREYVKSAFLGGAEDRIQALEGGQTNFGMANDTEGMKAEGNTWRELLQQHLDPSAFADWEARERKRADRRVEALSMMTVSELDRKLRLTPDQRQRLEPLVNKAVRDAKSKLDAFLAQNYANSELLMMVVNGIPATEVASLIDADQMAGWREVKERYSGWWNQFQ